MSKRKVTGAFRREKGYDLTQNNILVTVLKVKVGQRREKLGDHKVAILKTQESDDGSWSRMANEKDTIWGQVEST